MLKPPDTLYTLKLGNRTMGTMGKLPKVRDVISIKVGHGSDRVNYIVTAVNAETEIVNIRAACGDEMFAQPDHRI